jgi:hypothetical protein
LEEDGWFTAKQSFAATATLCLHSQISLYLTPSTSTHPSAGFDNSFRPLFLPQAARWKLDLDRASFDAIHVQLAILTQRWNASASFVAPNV